MVHLPTSEVNARASRASSIPEAFKLARAPSTPRDRFSGAFDLALGFDGRAASSSARAAAAAAFRAAASRFLASAASLFPRLG